MWARSSPTASLPWPGRRLRSWSHGLLCTVLLLALCLTSWKSWANSLPPTPPLGSSDYQEYKASLAVLMAKVSFYKSSFLRAISENSTVRDELQQALSKQEELQSELSQHKADSTKSYEEQQQTIQRLMERLRISDDLVSALRASLESAQKDYDEKLKTAQEKAKSIQRENGWLKIGLLLAVASALGLGVWAAVK